MAQLEIRNIDVVLGGNRVLHSVNLTVHDGECVALLGPSGCGKTTTLRAIAGFVPASAGDITVDGRSMTGLPPHRRNLGLVFQDYALFPHMTVGQNIAYGLVMRRRDKDEIKAAVADVLQLVRLGDMEHRYPAQMSGGQRQRVALARALIIKPDILLLDEPLGALDRKLRDHMQVELKRIQREVGITTIIVTHDQEEALSLSDRVAVMFDGQIHEFGAPDALYERPATEIVMDFLGTANFFDGVVAASEQGMARIETMDGLSLECTSPAAAGQAVKLGIRPEHVGIAMRPTGVANEFPARVSEIVYKGSHVEIYCVAQNRRALIARLTALPDQLVIGAPVHVNLPSRHLKTVIQSEGGKP